VGSLLGERDVPPRILVVDDDASVANVIETVLRTEGYTVAVARDGAQGLMLARDWRPDLILMDVMLPGVDGGTVTRRLKSEAATADIPIVAMSAGKTIRSRTAEIEEADGALAKPFDIDALLAQVAFHLARRPNEELAPTDHVEDTSNRRTTPIKPSTIIDA